MGDFATSESTAKNTETSTTKTDPWGPQADYLKDIFGKAQGLYGNQNTYKGDHVAQFNPDQLNLFKNMVSYANTSPIAQMLANQGQNLANLGSGAVGSGLEGLENFTPQGSVQGTIADAGLYADNPFISSMVDATMRDANRQVYEGQLPANQRARAMSGNTNSSKGAIQDAILERGLQDRTADVSAALRGSAYSQGLNMAQNQNQFNTSADLDRLRALTVGGLDTANSGAGSLSNSIAAMASLFGLGNEGASGLRDAEQAKLDNKIAKDQYGQSNAWQNLMNYYNIIGSGNWGGTSTGKGVSNQQGTQTASPAAVMGGILTSLGSLIPGSN